MVTRRQDVLRDTLRNKMVLFSCEGKAEGVIIGRLVEEQCMIVNSSQIIWDDSFDPSQPYTELRKCQDIETAFLNQDWEADVVILFVQDSLRHKPELSTVYRKHASCVNITTAPEIEILVIHGENRLSSYNKWKQRKRGSKGAQLKPSLFVKEVLGSEHASFKDVKNTDFQKSYWRDIDDLRSAIELYRQKADSKKYSSHFMLADLLNPS